MLSTLKCLGAFLLYIHVHAFMSKSDFKEICEVAHRRPQKFELTRAH